MRRRTRESGFSFIEVLIVVGVCLILFAIILPVFSIAKKKSKRTACVSNLKQIGMALQLYAQDNDEMLPLFRNRRHDEKGRSTQWDSPESLYTAVYSKAKDARILYCPADVYAGQDIEVFGINHKFSSYCYNMLPPDASEGTLTITGVLKGGTVSIAPADYPLVRDCNLGYSETVNGARAYGCEHLGCVNVIYVDLHVETRQASHGQIAS